jgi:hypothetical protein
MEKTVTGHLAVLAMFISQNTNTNDIVEEFSAELEKASAEEVDFDAAIDAAFGVAEAVAQKTPGGKDDQWIGAAKELYEAIKDPETGLIQDLVTFIRNRRAAK